MLKQDKLWIRESSGFPGSGPVIIEDTDVLGQVKSNRMGFIKSIKDLPSKARKLTVIKIDKKLLLWPWLLGITLLCGYLIYILWLKDQ
jgi:hypothetical protein